MWEASRSLPTHSNVMTKEIFTWRQVRCRFWRYSTGPIVCMELRIAVRIFLIRGLRMRFKNHTTGRDVCKKLWQRKKSYPGPSTCIWKQILIRDCTIYVNRIHNVSLEGSGLLVMRSRGEAIKQSPALKATGRQALMVNSPKPTSGTACEYDAALSRNRVKCIIQVQSWNSGNFTEYLDYWKIGKRN